jgi:hypothetical protein
LTFEDGGIYLPAFMGGVITTLLVLMLVTNQFKTSKVTKNVLESADAGDAIEAVGDVSSEDFDSILESGNREQLGGILSSLNLSARQQTDVPSQVQFNRRRVSVANRLLTKPLNQDQRTLAINSKIQALSTVYALDLVHGLREPNVAETLKSAAGEYINDGNKQISRTAKMAMLKHDAFELAKKDRRPNLKPISGQIVGLLGEYPDDDMMIATIKVLVGYLNEQNSNHGYELMREINSESENFDSPKVMELIQDFSDEAKMSEVEFDLTFENRWINGKIGEAEIVKKANELLLDPDIGTQVIVRVGRAANWFEQEGKYDKARSIYQTMENGADNKLNPDVADLAKNWASDCLIGLNLVDQKIDIKGRLHSGQAFDLDMIEKRGAVIVFWTTKNKTSVDSLSQVSQATSAWRKKGGVVFAVNVDEQPDSAIQSMVSRLKSIQFVGNGSSIFDQFPTHVVPRAIFVNRKGVVIDINVPITDIETEIASQLSSQQ